MNTDTSEAIAILRFDLRELQAEMKRLDHSLKAKIAGVREELTFKSVRGDISTLAIKLLLISYQVDALSRAQRQL